MKQGTHIFRILMIVLFAGVLAYFGVYLWNALTVGSDTATVYTYTASEAVETSGYFFRDETLLSQSADMAQPLCAEGERVGTGDVVARIYQSSEGFEIQQQLEEAMATRDSLYYIRSRVGSLSDSAALDDQIVGAFTALRGKVASGDLSQLDQSTGTLKSLIFRRDYSYNSTDTLDQQIEEAEAEVSRLTARASYAYTSVPAPASGLFSATVDGYEGVLTLNVLEDLTPARLASLAGRQNDTSQRRIGKIITNNGWYFACNVSAQNTRKLYKGAQVTLRFADAARDFPAKVLTVSAEQEGLVTIVFFSESYAAQVANLRHQNAEIITGTATGFRVPKRAVRVAEDGTLGIYRVAGAQAEWIDITILWEDEDYYLIAQTVPTDEEGNRLEQSAFQRATALREGDTVIVKGEALYDGKVVTD
ncbi:MAG: hypothetical protein IJ751_09665 [Oscillospiraceae bacterium]|nr:hypothetical protein [Oscillospiraceae bacterium]